MPHGKGTNWEYQPSSSVVSSCRILARAHAAVQQGVSREGMSRPRSRMSAQNTVTECGGKAHSLHNNCWLEQWQ